MARAFSSPSGNVCSLCERGRAKGLEHLLWGGGGAKRGASGGSVPSLDARILGLLGGLDKDLLGVWTFRPLGFYTDR